MIKQKRTTQWLNLSDDIKKDLISYGDIAILEYLGAYNE